MLDADQAKDELEKILQQDEYTAYHTQTIVQAWWERAKSWIKEMLDKLFPSYEATNAVAGPVLIAVLGIIVLLLALATFFIVRRVRRARMFRDPSPLQSFAEKDWSYQKHLSEAMKLQHSHRYTLATRHLFLALLLYFHEKEWLEARIWKTNWEYYDELKAVNSEWANQFYEFARLFDRATYGEHEVTETEYVHFYKEVMKWLEEEAEAIGR